MPSTFFRPYLRVDHTRIYSIYGQTFTLSREMAVVIREPEWGELMTLVKVHYDAWSEAYQDVYPKSFVASRSLDYFHGRWQTFLDDDVRPVLVADVDRQICGFVRYGRPGAHSKPQSSTTGEILNMYLLPQFRGRGIGTLLLNSAEESLCSLNYVEGVVFAAQEKDDSVRFYANNGWHQAGEPERADLGGYEALLVRLEKTFAPAPKI